MDEIDQAGPLWVFFEDFLDSWLVRPKRVSLGLLVIFAIVAVPAVLSNRKKP